MEGIEVTDIKERNSIYEIIAKYDLTVVNIKKFGRRFKIYTSNNCFWLYCTVNGRKRLHNSYKISEELMKNNFLSFDKFIRTKSNELYVRKRNTIFYLTECTEGEMLNNNSFSDALVDIRFLAAFHKVSKNIATDNFKLKKEKGNWIYIFNKNLSDIERYKLYIEKRRIKKEFDSIFYEQIEYYFKLGMLSINLLNQNNFYSILHKYGSSNMLCLDGLNKKYVTKKEGKCHLCSLELLTVDYYINDLNIFIKSKIDNPDIAWNFNKVKEMIEAYIKVNIISKEELGILLALLIFPYKFWKLGKKRYIKHKNWDENKYKEKLLKFIKYKDNQEVFIDDFLNYINSQ